ncbi:MAG: hypothetical protein R6V10_09780, partial [bacterium]
KVASGPPGLRRVRRAFLCVARRQGRQAGLDRNNYKPLLDMYVKANDKQAGEKAGYEYGEQFRYEMAGGPVAALASGEE